jgi:hypothetical protein
MSAMRIAQEPSASRSSDAVVVRPMKSADVATVARLEVESF